MKIIYMKCKYSLYTRNDAEALARKINRDRRLRAMVTFVLANGLYMKKAYAASNLDKVNSAGFQILNIVRTFGYWICIIGCIMEIVRSLMQGDTKSIGKIILKYVLGFGSFYFLPWFFALIREMFV